MSGAGGSSGDEAEAALEAGRLLFARPTTFLLSVADVDSLPAPSLPEVAFAGRSNVGKSSLINALTGRRDLARTSNTPGRTQMLNFFDQADVVRLVDMPGYGYARASKSAVKAWTQLIFDYLRGRAALRRVFILVDARHGVKANDEEVMRRLDEVAVSYQAVLTKADKIGEAELANVLARAEAALARHPAAHPHILATSAAHRRGIDELRAAIASLASS